MDTQNADQVTGWVATGLKVLEMFAGAPGVGLLVNLTLIQVIEAWDHVLPESWMRPGTRDIKKAMAVTLSIGLSTFIVSPLVMLLGGLDVRGINFLYGFIGGIGGVFVSAGLDKMGWNLDRMFGQEETPK